MIFYAVAVLVFILDQASKFLVKSNMIAGQSIPILKDLLHMTYVQNTGAAFGILTGYANILIPIGLIIMVFIVYFHWKVPGRDLWLQLALGLIFGGSLGNMYDRITLGYVVDFLDFRFFSVFNLADTLINVGVAIVIIRVIIFEKQGEKLDA